MTIASSINKSFLPYTLDKTAGVNVALTIGNVGESHTRPGMLYDSILTGNTR